MVSLLHSQLHLKGGSPFILTVIVKRKKRGVKLFSALNRLKVMAGTTDRLWDTLYLVFGTFMSLDVQILCNQSIASSKKRYKTHLFQFSWIPL